MKKKIREQLIVLARHILENTEGPARQEDSFSTTSIKELTGEIYEKLTILEYLENQLEDIEEPKMEESLDSKSFREENWFTEPEPVPQPEHKEDLIEPLMEKIKDIVAQMPEESESIDELFSNMLPGNNNLKTEEAPVKTEKYVKNDLEEFAANYQRMPEFERKQSQLFPPSTEGISASKNFMEARSKSLNDTAKKGLMIGLNDRLAFIKHLFEGHTEDYTRVLSQINTMSSFEEAQSFIKANVKPDYNHWTNKEEYSERFMAIIEKSFN